MQSDSESSLRGPNPVSKIKIWPGIFCFVLMWPNHTY